MGTYVKNYWSLYLDFIHDFQKLKYRGLSLSYLVHFPALIRKKPEVWNQFHSEEFSKQLNNKVEDQKDFQREFNQYLQSIKNKTLRKNKQGKIIVIGDRLIRFPESTYNEHFDPANTVVVKTNDNIPIDEPKTDISTKYISEYKTDVKKATVKIKNQLRTLLKSYNNHHLYNEKYFQKLLSSKLVAVVNQIEICKSMLNDIPASCIVLSSPNHFGRVVTMIAAQEGIPTICMQHGIIGNEFGYIPKVASVDAVYGQYEVDWYEKLEVPKGSLEIIGHPRFDKAFQSKSIKRSHFYNQLGLDKSKKTLLIVVRGHRSLAKWKVLIETITNAQDLNLNILVRDFPSTTPHALEKMFPFVRSTKSFDLYETLHNIDCVVAYTSTVGLEAMLVNKPVFILHNRLPSYTGYFDELGELVQKDPKKLGELIVRYFNDKEWSNKADEERKKFLDYAYPDLGPSGERLQHLIERLTK